MHQKKEVIIFIVLILFSFILAGCFEKKELGPSVKRIKENGVIVVGVSVPYEPMEYFDENGSLVGFDIDIANRIAEYLEVKAIFKNYEFDRLLDAVKGGEVDIAISAITITAERSKEVLFSKPYFNAGQIIIVRKSEKNISGPEDLKDKVVGVQNGTTSEEEALKYTGNSEFVKTFSNYDFALDALLHGEIDAIIIDYPAGVSLIKNRDDVKIVCDPFTNELYGIAMRKDEEDLKREIDKCLTKEFLEKLEEKWFKI